MGLGPHLRVGGGGLFPKDLNFGIVGVCHLVVGGINFGPKVDLELWVGGIVFEGWEFGSVGVYNLVEG